MRTLLGRWAAAYGRALHEQPIRTQVVSTGVLWALGDACAQQLESGVQGKGSKPYDLKRTLLTGAYGACFVGPFGHTWYMWLDRAARGVFRPGSPAFIAGKVVADTAVFGPLHIIGYFVLMTLGEGGTWADAREKVQRDFIPTFAAECAFWPAFQAVNFVKTPVQYQLLAVNCATILDSTFMSWCRSTDDWLAVLLPGAAAKLKALGLAGPPQG